VETDPLTAARESVKKVNMNKAMKDDSKKPIDDEFSTESVFAGSYLLLGILMINLLLVEKAFSINDIGRILVELVKTL
jgi:hypothetical protein